MLNRFKNSLANKKEKTGKPRRVFGRKTGRRLNKSRKEALENLLPLYRIPAPEDGVIKTVDLFGSSLGRTIFEVGFGNGEHLLTQLNHYPDANFIGAEPYINGMACFLGDLNNAYKKHPLPNLRVFMDDAIMIFEALEDQCLDVIYVLNPDPWPKTRHHKRRIINQKNLAHFHRTLKPQGRLVMATDVDDLAEWMVTQCSNFEGLEWTAQKPEDWQTPPSEWIETRYAFKGRTAGRSQIFLEFIKMP